MSARFLAVAAIATLGCAGTPAADAAPPAAPVSPVASTATAAAAPSPAKDESRFVVTESGELALPAPITFVVRPLGGPGTMGPSELSPESDAALSHVAAYVRAHSAADVRIECAINALKTSSGPNAGRGAHLAKLAARWLVERGISCKRLDPVGIVERRADAPAEQIRVFVRRTGEGAAEARADPCDSR